MTALGTIIVRFHSRIDNKTSLIVEKLTAFKLIFSPPKRLIAIKQGYNFVGRREIAMTLPTALLLLNQWLIRGCKSRWFRGFSD